jgi:tRNA(adenine34) deaminase
LNHGRYMRRAIEIARSNRNAPFGAVIVDCETREILAEGVNNASRNPILHGEITAILECAGAHPGVDWSRVALYTTAEPCPVCSSAVLWTHISHLIFGTSADTLQKLGRPQIGIRDQEIARRASFSNVVITGGVLETECDALYLDHMYSRGA